ncbi:hypothetical protein BU14_0526s0007 [Porphyra umbilicalis]|uniref:ABC1 atypical kinase-like domain-containing protein n=1 Tax=Porphyra umbilicalis TaxID=2786 RepID=A0A1X6NSN6_PORUM|nr:hypothetical protein BU14_0526s0007 [Porphyra umbilicalis]|eukprot:OSX71506.1 hypothetical protein BU14_0526s0007 [Porphyra umbilicalis]
MVLVDGLHHADSHPGNILIDRHWSGPRVGLVDFGQAKRLTPAQRTGIARLVVALADGDAAATEARLTALGVRIAYGKGAAAAAAAGAPAGAAPAAAAAAPPPPPSTAPTAAAAAATARRRRPLIARRVGVPAAAASPAPPLTVAQRHAYGMFDTAERPGVNVNPFGNAELAAAPVAAFPRDLFFLLRTVQILRGVAAGAGVGDDPRGGLVAAWAPLARAVLAAEGGGGTRRTLL